MDDIEIARDQIRKRKLAMVIVKNGEILFETQSHRISGFLDAICSLDEQLRDSAIADRVVGKAVALLCVYIKAKTVYAEVLSKHARIVLDEHGIACSWRELVEYILNADKSGLCPFEKIAQNISNPDMAFDAFEKFRKTLS